MKKFTIFLLFFLLFVGFSHVNAQSSLHTVRVEGPTSGCVGDVVTLTAVVTGESVETLTLQWKKDGQYLGQSGWTYQFIVSDAAELFSYYSVELSLDLEDCQMIPSPVHPFQVLPRTVLLVNNYSICENGMVAVTADAITFGGQIHRYIWYHISGTDTTAIDTTYTNVKLFEYAEILPYFVGDVATLYVNAEMFNSDCNSEFAEFTITKQGMLDEVQIMASATSICSGTLVLFSLDTVGKNVTAGIPTISWWVNGFEIPGESLPYLNIPFHTNGTHYVAARLSYPNNNCEYVTDSITIEVIPTPTVAITGNPLYCASQANVILTANIQPVLGAGVGYKYQWFESNALIDLQTSDTLNLTNLATRLYPYNYTVQIEDTISGCIIMSDVYPVIVQPQPVIPIIADHTRVCAGTPVTLTAQIGSSLELAFQWYTLAGPINGAISNPYTVMPTAETRYLFTATNINTGCLAISDTVTVEMGTSPLITGIAVTPDIICSGNQVTVTAQTTNTGIFTWYRNGFEIAGVTDSTFTETLFDMGEYIYSVVLATDTPGCVAQFTATEPVTVSGAVNAATAIITGTSVVSCNNGQIVLLANPNPMGTYTYQWYVDNDSIIGAIYDTLKINKPVQLAPYTFVVEVTSTGCDGIDVTTTSLPFAVHVEQLPVIGITADKLEVCAGEIVMLTANVSNAPNMNYQWYAKIDTGAGIEIDTIGYATAPIHYFAADFTRTFFFTATQIGSNCQATSNEIPITVLADTIPFMVTRIDTTTCAGNQLTYQVTGIPAEYNATIAWYINGQAVAGATHSTFTYQFNNPGSFVVEVLITVPQATTGCGSTMKGAGTVVVTAAPSVTIIGPELVCNTATTPATLFAKVIPLNATDITYTWFKNGAITGSDSAIQVIDTTASPYPYSYIVQITDTMSGCIAVSQIQTVYVEAHSVIGITADKTQICVGETVTLTANISGNSNIIYQWYADSVQISGANAPIYHVVPGSTTTYTFTATQTDSGCEAGSNEVTVVVIPEFILAVVPDTANICVGSQITFTANDTTNAANASTFTWYINGQAIAGQTHNTLTYQFSNPGVFDVSVLATTNLGGCASAMAHAGMVTVGMPFGVSVEGPELVCNTSTPAFLQAHIIPANFIDPNLTFQWYVNGVQIVGGDSIAQAIDTVASAYPYLYFVHVVDTVSGCEATSQVQTVYVEAHPVIGITADRTQVCKGEIVILTANVSGNSNITYQWYADSVEISGANAPIYHLTADSTATYTFIATQIGSGCQAGSNQVTVAVTNNLTVETGEPIDTTICIGSQITFAAENAVEYVWAINGIIVDGAVDSALTYRFDDAGVYTVTVSAAGCVANMQLVGTITVKMAPTVEIAGPILVCNAAEPTVLYAITTPVIPVPGFVYQWYLNGDLIGSGADTLTVANTASPNPYIYTVTVTDTISGCVATSATHIVYVEQFPVIGITADKTNVCEGEIIMLTANVSNAPNMIYTWFAGADSIGNAPILYVVADTTATYSFTATQIGSDCQATSNEVTVTVIPARGITIDAITMIPADGRICDGGQVTLTAQVSNPDSVAYYTWFVNGMEIPGQNMATILVSPMTVDQDTMNYIYNVVAVPYGTECALVAEPSVAQRVHVRRNPIVEIHGTQHVCDIYQGEAPDNAQANIEIIAYVNGIYQTWHCNNANPYNELDPRNTWRHYKWYLDGALYDVQNFCDAQRINIYLPARPEPYRFKMEYVSGLGCNAWSQEFEVFVHPQQVVTITSTEDVVCEGGSVTLTANLNDYNETDYVYQWYKGEYTPEGLIPGATQPNYTTLPINGVGEVTYFVEVKQNTTFNSQDTLKKCLVVAEYTLTVLPKPEIAQITISETHICSGAQVTLTAIPSENNSGNNPIYTWTRNGQIIEGVTGASFTESLNATNGDGTIYTYNVTVRYENSGCESMEDATLAQTVTVYRAPIVAIDGQAHICETNYIYLQANVDHNSVEVGNLTYKWFQSGEERLNEMIADPNSQFYVEPWASRHEPYVFTVEVSRGNGCTAISAPFLVWVHTLPVVNITATENAICEGGSVELTANLDDYNAEYLTYQWYKITYETDSIPWNGGYLPPFIDTIENRILGATRPVYQTETLTETTTFAVVVRQTNSECVATNIITINVAPKPVVVLPDIIKETICNGNQVFMTASTEIDGQVVTNVTYQWFENGVAIPNATGHTYTMTATAEGTYTYEVQAFVSTEGCVSERTLVAIITVENPVTVEITGNTVICENATGATLYATTNPIEAQGITYQWYKNGVAINVLGTNATLDISTLEASALGYSFTVQITDTVSGCTFLSPIHYVYVGQFSTIGITATPLSVCPGEQVMLTANITPEPNMTYAWYAGTVMIGNAPISYHTPEVTTTYTFIATQIGSECQATSNPVTVTVVPVEIPVLTISETMICNGGQVTISGDIDGTYTWRRNGQVFATDAGKVIVDQPAATDVLTTYTYTAMVSTTTTNACEPQYSEPVTVVVHPTIGVEIYGAHEVCTQATGDAHMWLHAIVTGAQEGVIYKYTLMYTQGEGPMVELADYYEPIDMPVPNTLPANDYAVPYNFFVKVTAIGYGCTAMSSGHEVNILTKPTVQISVDNQAICIDGTVTVTAHPTPIPTPENPYNYVWTLNGEVLPFNGREITIANDLIVGINNIAVRIERAYGSFSCFASNNIQVDVYDIPSLSLTQNYEGICTGGRISLTAAIVNFQGTNIPFTYQWERDGNPINAQSETFTEELNSVGTYQYRVRVTNNLGCNTEWTYFEPIKVVPQPQLTIERLGAQYNVCKEVTVVIDVNLNITDPTIQQASQYSWNDGEAGVYPIYSRIIEGFSNSGVYRYSLQIGFTNPTCAIATSNELVFTVVESPRWANLDVNPKWELCLGGNVDLQAQFLQGTTNDINIGTIQWQYSFNGSDYVDTPYIYVGGNKAHRPLHAGSYTYKVNYNPSNPATGCHLESIVFGPVTVLEAPTAQFANAEVPQIICASDLRPIDLVIEFSGVAPYVFRVEGPNGFSMNRSTFDNPYTFTVNPIPGTYKIVSMRDNSRCDAILFLGTEIEVVVSEVEVAGYVSACGFTAIVDVNVTSTVSNIATITFVATGDTQTQAIENNAITINVPETLPAGRYDVIITIDGCDYPTVVHIGNPIDGLSARFVDAPMLQVCTDGLTPVALEIEFEGVPPFYYMVAENNIPMWDAPRIALTHQATVVVVPVVTSVYTIISLANDAGCEILTQTTRPEILVTVGDIEIVTSVVAACEGNVATIEIISAITSPATITFGTNTQNFYVIPGHNTIYVDIPANTIPGAHDITLTVGRCDYIITIVYAANTAGNGSLIHRRWEGNGEVLVVSNNYCDPTSPYYNGGIEFTSYQWYKNGIMIPGATQQYYQDPAGINGEYSVHITGFRVAQLNTQTCEVITRGDRVEFTTCDQSFSPSFTVKVYPVPARVNQPVTVELDLSMAELEGATLDIYDAKGAHVQHIRVVSKITQIDGFKAQGTYFGKITTGTNEIKAVKFVIVK